MKNSAAILLCFLFVSAAFLACSGNSASASQSHSSSSSAQPIFVWYFGYVGNTFYPKTQLNLTQQQVLSAAAALSKDVNSTTRLRFVSAIDQLRGRTISWSSKSTMAQIKTYVGDLSSYGEVYGRLDLQQFNTTGFGGAVSRISIYNEVGLYVNTLSLRGIWLDHASIFYQTNHTVFNAMMQNLSQSFPGTTFILNQAYRQIYTWGIITPSKGTTWANQTFISPSVLSGSYYKTPALSQLKIWNEYYPGRVLLHWDSFAKESSEPMGVFANQSQTTENATVRTLASQGATLSSSAEGFTILYPILGGWTEASSQYHGTLYNSLNLGTFSRSEMANFATTMIPYP